MGARWWTVLVIAVLTVAGTPGAAQAHPFGDPQTVEVRATDAGAEVVWQAPVDDLTALALHLGLLSGTRSYVFENGAYVPEESDPEDAAVLAASPRLGDYLLGRIRITAAGGGACRGSLLPVTDLVGSGAVLHFECPSGTTEVEATISTLTDIHPAYRTLATGPGGQRHLYRRSAERHRWALDQQAGGGARATEAMLQLGVVGGVLGGAVIVLGAAGRWVLRRRRVEAGRR